MPCSPLQVLDILPGVSGGVARVMIGQPFDTIKTRLQVRPRRPAAACGRAAEPKATVLSGCSCGHHAPSRQDVSTDMHVLCSPTLPAAAGHGPGHRAGKDAAAL